MNGKENFITNLLKFIAAGGVFGTFMFLSTLGDYKEKNKKEILVIIIAHFSISLSVAIILGFVVFELYGVHWAVIASSIGGLLADKIMLIIPELLKILPEVIKKFIGIKTGKK